MGMFEVNVRVSSLVAPERSSDVSLLVDAGATISWIPQAILQKLGVTPLARLPFSVADGRRLERDVTAVLVQVDGRKAPVEVAKKLIPRDLLALGHRR